MHSSPAPNAAPTRDANAGVRTHEGVLTYPDRIPIVARVTARHRDAKARVSRAALTWAAGWGLAVAAVFLPVLHFVLVPLLLVGTPLLAWQRLHEPATLIDAEGACPACGAHRTFALGGAWRVRTALRCEACGRALVLELPSAPTAS